MNQRYMYIISRVYDLHYSVGLSPDKCTATLRYLFAMIWLYLSNTVQQDSFVTDMINYSEVIEGSSSHLCIHPSI